MGGCPRRSWWTRRRRVGAWGSVFRWRVGRGRARGRRQRKGALKRDEARRNSQEEVIQVDTGTRALHIDNDLATTCIVRTYRIIALHLLTTPTRSSPLWRTNCMCHVSTTFQAQRGGRETGKHVTRQQRMIITDEPQRTSRPRLIPGPKSTPSAHLRASLAAGRLGHRHAPSGAQASPSPLPVTRSVYSSSASSSWSTLK